MTDHPHADPGYEQITVDDDGSVATITLNRPEQLNAWTWRMGAELNHAIAAFDARDDIRVIVVTGAGRTFCAGADLGGGSWSSTGDRRAVREQFPSDGKAHHQRNTPIIAAMQGSAVGVGMTMVTEWDIRVACDNAKYGYVFNRRGVIPEVNAQWLLPRLVGASRAMELLLTGRVFRGTEGEAMGLFTAAVPGGEVLDRAMEIASDIAVNTAPVSAAIVKRNVWRALEESDRDAAHEREQRLFGFVSSQPDAAEGAMAFVDKRDPDWKLGKADVPEEFLG